jgi:hypothetical protein
LRLLPPDMTVVVTIDKLREQAGAFLKSDLAAELRQLPAVRDWFASEKFQQFERARTQIETHLGVNLSDLRDELLGDAVVLALRLPPEAGGDANQARGILLVEARNVALLRRLIEVVNSSQQESGELSGVAARRRNGTTYHVREFPPAANRPPEWYVDGADGTFAISNSEPLIHAVIDRRARVRNDAGAPGRGLEVDPGFGELVGLKAVARQLPDHALARLFVNPRHFARVLTAQPRAAKPSNARMKAVVERYLAAVDYAGAALTWSDESIVIRSVETLHPSLLDPWLRRWAVDHRRLEPSLSRVPSTALAVASARVDASAVLDAITQIVPDDDQPRLANLQTLASGLLLGQDLRTQVLPRLGPGVVAYLDTAVEPNEPGDMPGAPGHAPAGLSFPLVVVVDLASDPGTGTPRPLAAAADNALRTVLAMTALDDKRAEGRSRITARIVAGTTVTTLEPPVPFAYAVDGARHRVVLSNSPGAVARYLESSSGPNAGEHFRQARAAAFASADSYACVDLEAVDLLAVTHRAALVQTLAARQKRPVDEVDRDLAQVLALARLFRAGFVTSRFEADATAVHRSAGLLRRRAGPK